MKIVNNLIEAMLAEVAKHGLELMQRYPDDLIKHDRNRLEGLVVDGAKIAWMVGDSHTHMVLLGFHQDENQIVDCLLNMSNSDHFYLIEVNSVAEGTFKLKELDRIKFAALRNTPVAFSRVGDNFNFNIFNYEQLIASVNIEVKGGYIDRVFNAEVVMQDSITKLQETAVKIWSSYGLTKAAGTLFIKTNTVFLTQTQKNAQNAQFFQIERDMKVKLTKTSDGYDVNGKYLISEDGVCYHGFDNFNRGSDLPQYLFKLRDKLSSIGVIKYTFEQAA